MADSKRDANRITTLIGVSSTDGETPTLAYINATTNRLLTDGLSTSIPATTGGLIPYQRVSTADNNADTVKASAGQVYSIQAFNNSANIAYLKLYNKASNPAPATDTPLKTILIPANSLGSGAVFDFGNLGLQFATGIAIAIVAGIATNDNTAVAANETVVNIDYK